MRKPELRGRENQCSWSLQNKSEQRELHKGETPENPMEYSAEDESSHLWEETEARERKYLTSLEGNVLVTHRTRNSD